MISQLKYLFTARGKKGGAGEYKKEEKVCTTLKQDAVSVRNKLHLHSPWRLQPGDPTVYFPRVGQDTWVVKSIETLPASLVGKWWQEQPNARAERLQEIYRGPAPFVIPSVGFQERLLDGSRVLFALPNDEPFLTAAIAWQDPTGKAKPIFSVLTREEGPAMGTQHGRMPVLFTAQRYLDYLTGDLDQRALLIREHAYIGPFEWMRL